MNTLHNVINFKANRLEDLIIWTKNELTEPPLTFNIPTHTLEDYCLCKNPPKTLFEFPNHTQGTERYIPVLSESGDKSEIQREGSILAKLASRELNPAFRTKKDYNLWN